MYSQIGIMTNPYMFAMQQPLNCMFAQPYSEQTYYSGYQNASVFNNPQQMMMNAYLFGAKISALVGQQTAQMTAMTSGNVSNNTTNPASSNNTTQQETNDTTSTTSTTETTQTSKNNDSNVTFSNDTSAKGTQRRVDTKCGLTAEQLNKHLKGVLAGKGQKFLDAEAKYGVNAAFLVAICRMESGAGTSNAAKTLNNVCGIKPHGKLKEFPSIDACIDAEAANIATSPYYFKRDKKSIGEIAPVYCNNEWGKYVGQFTDEIMTA